MPSKSARVAHGVGAASRDFARGLHAIVEVHGVPGHDDPLGIVLFAFGSTLSASIAMTRRLGAMASAVTHVLNAATIRLDALSATLSASIEVLDASGATMGGATRSSPRTARYRTHRRPARTHR